MAEHTVGLNTRHMNLKNDDNQHMKKEEVFTS